MKIRPGQAGRNEKASSVYRLRQSTKDESMKRFLPLSHFSCHERNMAETPLGLRWTALSLIQFWFKNYLSWWLQRVGADGAASQWASVTSDVSQGDLLGPLLFTRFINDLPNASEGKVMTKVTTRSLKTTEILSRLELFSCANVDNQQDLRPRYLHFISLSLSRTGANEVKTTLTLIEKNSMQGWQCTAKGWFGHNILGNQTRLSRKKIL